MTKGGVKTEEGKAISKYNAQRHAILRESVAEHEKVDYEDIFNQLSQDLAPKNYLEEKIIEILAINLIRLQRITKAEAEVMKEAKSPTAIPEIPGIRDYGMPDMKPYKSYEAPISIKIAQRLELFSRYQIAAENRIYRAVMMLKQLKYDQG